MIVVEWKQELWILCKKYCAEKFRLKNLKDLNGNVSPAFQTSIC